MANRYTGNGYYVFTSHRFVDLFGTGRGYENYRVCMFCGEQFPRDDNECHARIQLDQIARVRARRAAFMKELLHASP